VAAVTRLGLYGGPRGLYGDFSTKVVGVVVAPRRAGRRKKTRYVVEVDGQFFEVSSIAAAESILLRVRDLANESAQQDVTTALIQKPPKIAVRTIAGNVTTSKILQQQVRRTQTVVNQAYLKRSREIAQDIEISQLIIAKIKQEDADDESAIIALLLM